MGSGREQIFRESPLKSSVLKSQFLLIFQTIGCGAG